MKSIAVLQARTTSSRLPGKVMLPIRGIPIVVLAAQRAANTGRQVVVATSRESTDDALALLVQQHGLKCSRGSLDNTLSRVVDALSGYDEDTLVFRLTADNVFPDGSLLDEIEEEFKRRNLNYICCNGERSGLPYGMSAELTFLKHLREASISTDCRYDQEHVTPYIRRTFGEYFFEKYRCINRSRFRCTIDCLDDYLGIQSVFSEVKDPINASAHDLSKRLAGAPYQPFFEKLAPKLVLGTAQLGLSYGIANKYGKPDRADAVDIIKTAIANGTAYIDTARAYGDSEDTIGDVLKAGWEGRAKIVTKLSPMLDCEATASIQTVKAHVDASIFGSCSALMCQELGRIDVASC
jgi:spore coat polysaccharide biosynthesis protein SpsF (cytidylyltransferase family)